MAESKTWCVLVRAKNPRGQITNFILGSKPAHVKMTKSQAEKFMAERSDLIRRMDDALAEVISHEALAGRFGKIDARLMLEDAGLRHQSALSYQREEDKLNAQLSEKGKE